jgi:hypothetical protein
VVSVVFGEVPQDVVVSVVVVFGLTVHGATQRWQRDCKHSPVVALLAREVEVRTCSGKPPGAARVLAFLRRESSSQDVRAF